MTAAPDGLGRRYHPNCHRSIIFLEIVLDSFPALWFTVIRIGKLPIISMSENPAQANGRVSRKRYSYEATQSRAWLLRNRPDVFWKIRARAERRYPRPRGAKKYARP